MTGRSSLSTNWADHSIARVVRRLEEVFPWVHVNPLIGWHRVNHLLERLRRLRAPEVIVRAHEEFRERAVQVTVYDGDPPAEVLDLTVRPFGVYAYHPEGVEGPLRRAAEAIGYEVTENPIEEGEFDERESPEELGLRARMAETRRAVAVFRDRFEGAEAIYVSESLVSRMRVSRLRITDPYFAADLELLPTPGLVNERMPRRIVWPWDQFRCGPDHWISGPYVVTILHFGDYVAQAVRFCESLADTTYTPDRRRQIAAAVRGIGGVSGGDHPDFPAT